MHTGVRIGRAGARAPEYRFRRCGVPDFDQLRMALPGSPNGKMYCAPTSAIDWMAYIADRGSPQVMPGPGMAGNDVAIDQAITSMGAFMSTDPIKGTDGDDAVAAIRDWFDLSYGGRGGDFFTVWGYWRAGEETIDGVTHYHYPGARQLAGTAAMGWLIAPNIGWYKFQDGHMVRDGGHVVALASAEPDLWTHVGAYTLGFADPATDDGNANRQGVFTVDPVPARPTQISTDPSRIAHLDKLWAPGYSTGYLEGGYVISHKFGLLPDPAEPGRRMTLTRAVQLDEGPGDRVIETLDGHVLDIALGADGVSTTAVLDDGRLALDRQRRRDRHHRRHDPGRDRPGRRRRLPHRGHRQRRAGHDPGPPPQPRGHRGDPRRNGPGVQPAPVLIRDLRRRAPGARRHRGDPGQPRQAPPPSPQA